MPTLPERIEELTPTWLTATLQAEGVLSQASVVDVKQESLDGVGLIASVARLHLSYDQSEADAPETLIAKLPTPVEKNRHIGTSGDYEREVRFYQALAETLPVRVPRACAALFEGDDEATAKQELSQNPDQRFVLLLEDMAPAEIGDDMAGCGPELAADVLRTVAKMHAAFWESPVLDEHWWLWRVGTHSKAMQQAYVAGRETFDDYYRERLPAWVFERLDWLNEHGYDLNMKLREAPRTFLHVDFRLDNLFFSPKGEIILFDWQTPAMGPAVYDVCSFLGNSVVEDTGTEHLENVLSQYHDALCELGVAGYSMEDLRRDYAMQLLLNLREVVVNFTFVEWADARAIERRDLQLNRKLARLKEVAPDQLL